MRTWQASGALVAKGSLGPRCSKITVHTESNERGMDLPGPNEAGPSGSGEFVLLQKSNTIWYKVLEVVSEIAAANRWERMEQ